MAESAELDLGLDFVSCGLDDVIVNSSSQTRKAFVEKWYELG